MAKYKVEIVMLQRSTAVVVIEIPEGTDPGFDSQEYLG